MSYQDLPMWSSE